MAFRRRTQGLAAAVALGTALAALGACGLDESGLLAPDGSLPLPDADLDAGPGDAVDDAPLTDVWVSPTCSTIDASCLGDAGVPDGWVLVDIAEDAGACPGDSEDFEPHAYVENPRLRSDSCTCAGCTTSGAWSCAGNVSLHGGTSGSCTGQSAQIANTAQCVSIAESAGLGCLLAQSATVNATPPTISGSPTCDASFTGSKAADTDQTLACKPARCTSDYCGLRASGFQTCILHDNDPSGVCPAGFHPAFGASARATAPGNVVVTCGACPCTVAQPGACSGKVRVFAGANASTCDGDGGTNGLDYTETLDASGTCENTGICSYGGLYWAPNPTPVASCTPTSASQTTGDASLANAVTICCAP